jgi:hypothetical protein
MSNPYAASTKSSSSNPYGGAPSGGGGGHGLLHNLLSDAITTGKGIVPGMVQFVQHPVTSVELAWAQTKAMYSPLFHGQFGTFYENFHSHPLQPLLDAISIPAMAAGGLGAGIKGASAVADFGRMAELSNAGRLAEVTRAGGMTAELSRSPGLFRAAEHFRPGTEHTARQLATPIPGYHEVQAYSTNLWRRALTRGTDALLEGVSGPLVKHGRLKAGGALDYTELGRGTRALAKTQSRRTAATVAAAKGEVHAIHAATKKGGLPDEISAGVLKRFDESFLNEAMLVDPLTAVKTARRGGALAHFRYIKDAKPNKVTLKGTDPANITDFAAGLKKRFTLTDDPAKAMKGPNGHLLMVRKNAATVISNEYEHTGHLLHAINAAPMRAWKYMVLAQAPRYFVNNVVGNVGMLAAATHPVALTRGVLDAVRSVHGNRAAVRMARKMNGEVDAEIERYMPQDFVNSTMGYMQHGSLGLDNALGFKPGVKAAARSGVKSGLYGVTESVAYRSTQRVGFMAALRENKNFRDLERAYRMQNPSMSRYESFQAAARKTLQKPEARAAIEKRVADWAGQYYHLNSLERKITALVPFYNWDRHALRFGKEQVLSRPTQSAALAVIGQQGDQYDRQMLGDLPDYMKGAVPIPGHLGGILGFILGGDITGRKKVVLTNGLNPLGAAADDANAVASIVGLGHGSAGEALGGQLSPLVAGAISSITGQNLVTGGKVNDRGGPVGTALSETFGNLPQAKLLKTLLEGEPSTTTSKGKPTLYTHDLRSQIASLFGLSLRDFSPETAAIMERKASGSKTGRKKKNAYT